MNRAKASVLIFLTLGACNQDASLPDEGVATGPQLDFATAASDLRGSRDMALATTPDAASVDAATASADAANPADLATPPDLATNIGTWTISGASNGSMYVDDDVIVSLDGTQVFSNYGAGAENVSSITVQAAAGDWVTMSFFNYFGGAKSQSGVWLTGPGVPAQQVTPAFAGVGSSYPVDTVQPFYISVFQLPAAGQTAAQGCLPDIALNTANWKISSYLQIHTMTTKVYDATWTVNDHEYQYTPDCNGWIGDIFIDPNSDWATVQWNVITNQMSTSAVSGHAYSSTIATSCAQYAVQTLFPPGDLGMLTID